MNTSKPLILVVLPLIFQTGYSQVSFFNINNSSIDTVPCNTNCITLFASHPDLRKTNTYTYSQQTSFTPSPIPFATSIILPDDHFSTNIPIGFNFCFYQNTYAQCFISSNGQITFDTVYNNAGCSHATTQTLPYVSNVFPDNAIFMPFVDLDTISYGVLQYATIGTAPFRKFIVKFSNAPIFDTCLFGTVSMQCELNETYNTIDIFILSKPLCNNNSGIHTNYATLGIQDIGGFNNCVVNGRNASIWSASNEHWRFSPAGPASTHVNWYNEQNILLFSNQDTVQFCSVAFPRQIHATLSNDCPNLIAQDTITLVQFLPMIDSIATTPATCFSTANGTATVYATSIYLPIQYKVDSGPWTYSNTFTNLTGTYHYFYIQDALGCTDTLQIQIPVSYNLYIVVTASTPNTCSQNNGAICVQAMGGVPPYTYSWGTNCLTNLPGGFQYLTVTDSVGCQYSQYVYLNTITNMQLSADINQSICGQNGSIDLHVSGGNAPYTYIWSTMATTEDISGLQPGGYTVMVLDFNGCSTFASFVVEDTLNLKDSIQLTVQPTCGLNNGELLVHAYDGLAPYHYAWNNGDTTSHVFNLAPGIYTCLVTDANGCSYSCSDTLTISYGLLLNSSKANTRCDSVDNGMIFVSVFNGTAPYYYQWSNSGTTAMITGLTIGTYTVQVTDALGCTKSKSVTIDNDGAPDFEVIQKTEPRCFGDANGAINIVAAGGLPPYKFSTDGINYSYNSSLSGLTSGYYTIYLRDANYCWIDTVLFLEQPTPVELTQLITDSITCYGDNDATLFAAASGGTPNYSYQLNNNGWVNQGLFTNLGATIYTVSAEDSHHCTQSTTVAIEGPLLPISYDKQLTNIDCYKDSSGSIAFTIEGGWGAYRIEWFDGWSSQLQRDNLNEGMYVTTLQDALGCSLKDTSYLDVQTCCNVSLPNAFSPNDDGLNDIFRPIAPRPVREQHFMIYNRWGQRVFESEVFEMGWDGKILGNDADMGTYFYLYSYTCNSTKQKIMLKGDVTLVR